MEIIKTLSDLKSWREKKLSQGISISCVPTMGYLHEGHASLIQKAREITPAVITTVFVNPTQFSPSEDLAQYPRDLDRDIEIAKKNGSEVLFIPTAEEIYSDDFSTFVTVEGITNILEGEFRPTHFRGVATIVTKLLLMTKAASAIFGQKDFQQTLVVKRLVKDLNIDCEIVVCPIIRESDGLALSSRNVYLSKEERKLALGINKSLKQIKDLVVEGERARNRINDQFKIILRENGITEIDYAEALKADDLSRPELFLKHEQIVLLVTARVGKVRLLDNALVF